MLNTRILICKVTSVNALNIENCVDAVNTEMQANLCLHNNSLQVFVVGHGNLRLVQQVLMASILLCTCMLLYSLSWPFKAIAAMVVYLYAVPVEFYFAVWPKSDVHATKGSLWPYGMIVLKHM